jgi:hypothetical protein
MQGQALLHAENIRKRPASREEQPAPISAELTGSHQCEALGIVATGRAPALALCARPKSRATASPIRKNLRRVA